MNSVNFVEEASEEKKYKPLVAGGEKSFSLIDWMVTNHFAKDTGIAQKIIVVVIALLFAGAIAIPITRSLTAAGHNPSQAELNRYIAQMKAEKH